MRGTARQEGTTHIDLALRQVRCLRQEQQCDRAARLRAFFKLVYQGKNKMSDTPTPETDSAQHEGLLRTNPIPLQVVTAEFARKLERERDEAREQLRIAVGLLSTHPQFANKHTEDVLDFVKGGAK
jgi:hypothetical protein